MSEFNGRPLSEIGSELEGFAAIGRTDLLRDFAAQNRNRLPLALVDLCDWAEQTADAVRHRAAGRIADALAYERGAERAYKRLPEGDRW